MASNRSVDLSSLQSLTDCIHFANGLNCKYGNSCRFRHCRQAIQQNNRCFKWPHSCTNVNCRYRHPSISSNASKSPQLSATMSSYSPLPKQQPKLQEGIVSVFWDLENVQIPRAQKPFDIVQRIRHMLVIAQGLREVGFTCYCDVGTISQANQLSLAHANVRISHVPDRKPGGVDLQILLDLDRFERNHRPPATIVLISGDIDFVGKLGDLRHQAHFEVIVIHNKPAKQELKATVNAHYSWDIFTSPKHPPTINALGSRQMSSAPGAPPINPMGYCDYASIYDTDADYSPPYPSFQAVSFLQCPQCTSEFETENSLQQHQVAKQHLFNCSSCDERFFILAAQLQHEKNTRHCETEEYSCTDCKKSFRNLKSLEQHENATGHGAELFSSSEHSDTNTPNFYCSKCNTQFKSAGIYLAHLLIYIFD